MLKKTERLDDRLFKEYFTTGKRNHNTYTTIITSSYSRLKVAVVVGKKVYKRAVDRNRLRRQVYGMVEKIKQNKDLTGVFIIILKPKISSLSNREQKAVLNKEVGLVLK